MNDAIWREYELYCPVCNAPFKQLVMLHKVPDDFDIAPYLQGFIERHDHNAFEESRRQKSQAAADPKKA